MPKNEEGEFELVLGNKQLLSVFFIVVVLLGVFFTMGYIVGRNTGAEAATQMAAAPGQPLVVESETPATASTSPPPSAVTPAKPPPKPVPARTQTPPPKPPPVQASKPAAVKQIPPPSRPAPTPPPSTAQAPLVGQTFLQVAATSSPEGEVLRDVLAKRGFKCQLAPVPGQDLIRVLVGPLESAEEISSTRSQLQAAGFKPFTRKYN